jgi:DNA-binding transcriptional ArsR family regulator
MANLDHSAAMLEALGNSTRLSIYRYLVRAGTGGRTVGEIQEVIAIPASTLSHHLKYLEKAGLVLRRKDGVTHFCTANYAAMDELIGFLTEECCADGNPPAQV